MSDSVYGMELRLILCPRCGAPAEVPPAGGSYRCSYCGSVSQVAGRASLPAFATPAQPTITESERLARLRTQEHRWFMSPPSIARLPGPDGLIPASRQQEALAIWQSARQRTAMSHAPDAAEELFFLTSTWANQLLLAGDLTRHRAMLESAFEVLFLPRHRTVIASYLCVGALRRGDVAAAGQWLALCEPTSEDLFADSCYRIARARLDRVRGDFPAVLATLGASVGEVPVHANWECAFGVERANALEWLGRLDDATMVLVALMRTGELNRAGVPHIAQAHGLCARSLPRALVAG